MADDAIDFRIRHRIDGDVVSSPVDPDIANLAAVATSGKCNGECGGDRHGLGKGGETVHRGLPVLRTTNGPAPAPAQDVSACFRAGSVRAGAPAATARWSW